MVRSFPLDYPEHGAGGSADSTEREAYIALGTNQGDRGAMLCAALDRLSALRDVRVTRVSAVYETDPVGYTEQPAFLNMVAAVQTALEPDRLLAELLRIEHELGRVRDIRWGPRTIDLDLLMMEGVTMNTEQLTIPHPRMMERAFVLVPLCEVLDETMPQYDEVEAAAQQALGQGKEGIARWNTINWHSASALFES
ncbi:2-amino-4-hydroxy-6-hydroxymethyldihydropteridine diphosphokinase [Paenibacillus sambharensis]|uniref:2-amino-4-hydroxy-6-hydroxymethyldihydropteridine diphosphokinase n=1 Tax=Paenibacillus sambharensis TaxID=1803190 RepID=A0A2W1LIV7_9BACL|nr:2-amino-4-hydroxy-6-hydroxymethyldihydropteridine diphosphokinase [Paenibacillus sambharensis]PZD94835.1 2-amino-4-hydroxy-6-hydroxymethyldihydropteridine diphosphokinase [Paenibacillus sambharensis]